MFGYLRTLATWYCPHSSAAAAAIHRYTRRAHSGKSAAQRVCWDRQTDRRTDTVLLGMKQKQTTSTCK